MKTLTLRTLLKKTYCATSKLSAAISNAIASVVNEAMSPVFPADQLRRVRVAVRVENHPYPYGNTH